MEECEVDERGTIRSNIKQPTISHWYLYMSFPDFEDNIM